MSEVIVGWKCGSCGNRNE